MNAPSPPETERDIDELCDHVEWVVHLLRLRTAANDVDRAAGVAGVIATQAAIAARAPTSTAHGEIQARLGLTDTEMQIVWILAAAALDDRVKQALIGTTGMEPALSLESLRRIVYGSRPSGRAIHELGSDGTLRRLRLIERSDAGDAHESRWSWALSRRALAWLHGDGSIDPAIRGVAGRNDVRPLDDLVVDARARTELENAVRGTNVVVVTGTPGMGRRSIAIASARHAGIEVLVIDASRLAKDARLNEQCRNYIASAACSDALR